MIRKLLEKFLILTRARQIAVVVFALHFLTVFCLMVHHLATYKSPPKRPIAVRTRPFTPQIASSPPIKQSPPPTSTSKKNLPPKQPPKPASKPTPKPDVAKSKPLPQIKTTPPVAKTKEIPESQSVLQEIAESFDAIAAKEETPSSKTTLAIPSRVQRKAEVAQEASTMDASYSEELIAFLQNALDLPEFGEVKVRLEIDRFGALRNCSILDSKSRKNAEFLKNRLPELTFPSFNDFSIVDITQSFTITFRNVENR